MKAITIFKTAICIVATFQTAKAQDKYQPTLIETVSIKSNKLETEFTFLNKGNYKIYEGKSPETINWSSAVNVQNNNFLKLKKNSQRPFYAIITQTNDTLMVAERKIPFNKVMNFRDLGGIKTNDNRYVKWGAFYRADALDKIDYDEFELINTLGIKKVFDLRSNSEVEQAPNQLPAEISNIHYPIFDNMNNSMFEGIEEKIKTGKFSNKEASEMLTTVNQLFVEHYNSKFKGLLHQVFNDNEPIVYHCTAGKDRTGFTTALILSVLNVNRELILDEYTMTNYYTKDRIAQYVEQAQKGNEMLSNVNAEAIEILMGVDRRFLEAAFDIIDTKYGGIDAYLKNQMGISDQRRKELIAKYTYSL